MGYPPSKPFLIYIFYDALTVFWNKVRASTFISYGLGRSYVITNPKTLIKVLKELMISKLFLI
jgi:hypothetical protein